MPVAWVTGGSRGIGRAIVLRLAAAGYDLVLTYATQPAAAAAVVDEVTVLGRQAQAVHLDFLPAGQSAAECNSVIAALLRSTDCPQILVHNAGRRRDGLFAAASKESWDAVMGCNLDSFYTIARPVVRHMLRGRIAGRIVCVASVAGQCGNAGQVAYSASKAGLIGASKALALELAPRGIAVNAVAPGLIATDMTQGLDAAATRAAIPMGRMGTPDEVADLVGFLCCSAGAGYITGQVIGINGGLLT